MSSGGQLQLKVPLKWNRLASLEKLLAASPQALQFTRILHIIPQQAPIKDDRYGSLDKLQSNYRGEDDGDGDGTEEEDEAFKLYTPGRWASSALNSLVRLLILKLSRQQLRGFRWNHDCPLATSTLAVLLNNNGSSLQTLELRPYTDRWKKTNLAALTIPNLSTLKIAALNTDGGDWPFELLARNYESLRDLMLGNETRMALEYKQAGALEAGNSREIDTEHLVKLIKPQFDPLNEVLQLDSLSTCGFDIAVIAKAPSPFIDFNNLSTLVLKSCSGLDEAFRLLVGTSTARRDSIGALKIRILILRHENTTNAFLSMLLMFLKLLRPLATLQGITNIDVLGDSLKVHRISLESLIWDERAAPRTHIYDDTALTPVKKGVRNLKAIAKHCVKLKALGIPLQWQELKDPDSDHAKTSSYFSKFKRLQTLNIRNLPRSSTVSTWLPYDYMLDSLASMLLNIIHLKAQANQSQTLRTLAIGALTYGNVMMGVNHCPTHNFANFLQLRIYHVNYDYSFQGVRTPRLHMIAKSTPADAVGYAENLDIFNICWLDGAPKKPRH